LVLLNPPAIIPWTRRSVPVGTREAVDDWSKAPVQTGAWTLQDNPLKGRLEKKKVIIVLTDICAGHTGPSGHQFA
jgi:hypothetical protein